jgi:hypothetical protein
MRRIRCNFQKTLAAELKATEHYDPVDRMRQKLDRWRLPGMEETLARRSLRRLVWLRDLVTPRVCAAVLSTMWNRWPTARRYQKDGRCVLLCSSTAQDSIEHYACCPVIRDAARRHLNLHLRGWPYALTDLMLASGPPTARHPTEDERIRVAILNYAAYLTTNSARHCPPQDAAEAAAMLQQAIAEGARDHARSQLVLRRAWLPVQG